MLQSVFIFNFRTVYSSILFICILEWIFKVFDEDGGGTIDIDELIKIVIGLFNMSGEKADREIILACVIELLDVIDEDGNEEITIDEFVNNGMKSGFIRNLMEFFSDDDQSKLKLNPVETKSELSEEKQNDPETLSNNFPSSSSIP